jgi:hypothetical protein
VLSRQELGRPVFPADYADTKSGTTHNVARSARLLEKWLAHPPAKRCPYFVGDGSPFYATPPATPAPPIVLWSSGSAISLAPPSLLVPVTIQYCGRGSPLPNAAIYRVDATEAVSNLRPLSAEVAKLRNETAVDAWANGVTVVEEEQRVGVVHGGGVSMLRGIGFGVGLVRCDVLAAGGSARVWVRNLGSKHCFEATVKRIVE